MNHQVLFENTLEKVYPNSPRHGRDILQIVTYLPIWSPISVRQSKYRGGGAEVGIHYTDYRQNTFCVLSPCLWFKAMIKSSPVLKYEDLTRIGSWDMAIFVMAIFRKIGKNAFSLSLLQVLPIEHPPWLVNETLRNSPQDTHNHNCQIWAHSFKPFLIERCLSDWENAILAFRVFLTRLFDLAYGIVKFKWPYLRNQ